MRWWPFGARRTEHPAAREATVSVVVPVKNAGRDLPALLGGMKEQQGFRAVEIVIVDSGSTDGSDAVASASGARLVRLAPREFSHSHARNLGAEQATGDYVLFTVQDARPSGQRWLLDMFEGLGRHQAAAVTCGEQPRADADLFYRAISWYHHRFMSPDGRDFVMAPGRGRDALARRRNGQLSDTACLIGRPLFLAHRHRGSYAEDLDLGLRLVAAGYRLAFLSGPRIVHSHNRPAYYHLRRAYVEHLVLLDLLPDYPTAPGDGEGAVRDVIRSARAVDGIVAALASAVPRSAAALRNAVGAAGASTTVATPAGHALLDPQTRAFLDRLGADDGAAGDRDPATALSVAGLLCDYLDAAGPTIDDALLDEFKAGLYKGWALHGGVRLASATWLAKGVVPDALRFIHEELTQEV